MDLREITIGRSSNCDIYLDPRCDYASNMHATIYYNGQHLVFRDTSTNGTIINGRLYKHQEVIIHHGDQIVLAGKYPLPWQKIDSFFPVITGTMAQQAPPRPDYVNNQMPPTPPAEEYVETGGWSWGAFSLYPIWGFANGCWWAIFIAIGAAVLSILSYLLMIYLTRNLLVSFFIAYVVSLIPSLIFGLNGRKWAWNNKNWASAESFAKAQRVWNIIGLILFIVSIAIVVIEIIAINEAMNSVSLYRYLY